MLVAKICSHGLYQWFPLIKIIFSDFPSNEGYLASESEIDHIWLYLFVFIHQLLPEFYSDWKKNTEKGNNNSDNEKSRD